MAIALLVAALGVTGTMLKGAWEDVAALEVQYENQQAETTKANQEITNLKVQHAAALATAQAHLNERNRENAELKSSVRKIESTKDTLAEALKAEPIRSGRVATILDARSLRDVCRASGGSPDACKINLPKPAKARSPDPATVGSGANPVLGAAKAPAR